MTELLLSIVGLLLADRMLYRFEMFSYLSSQKRRILMLTTVVIYILISIFKELTELKVLSYLNFGLFGIFFLFLMFFYIFHEKKMKIFFENRQKPVLDELILHIKSGKSPLLAYELILNSMSATEKRIFGCIQPRDSTQNSFKSLFGEFYFIELNRILNQRAKVIEQLEMFRTSLNIQIKMRRRSSTVAKSLRAQATVAFGIYLIFIFVSWTQFSLAKFPNVLILSMIAFMIGEFLVFNLGKSIKWTA